jgi:hypothetical protein
MTDFQNRKNGVNRRLYCYQITLQILKIKYYREKQTIAIPEFHVPFQKGQKQWHRYNAEIHDVMS